MAAYDASVRSRRWHTLLMAACIAAAMLLASISAEVSPVRFFENIHRFPSYIIRLFHLENGQPVWTDFGEWFWGLGRWFRLLWETLLMAYVGTLLGAVAAACLAFLGAANVAPTRWVRLLVRRFCELCRTVPELVFALLFASWHVAMRFGALPQVLSNFASYALLRFEINVRGAAVMGFVGAGGIGQDLIEAIRKFYYSDVSAILVMILLTVAVIDSLTSLLRHRLIGLEGKN